MRISQPGASARRHLLGSVSILCLALVLSDPAQAQVTPAGQRPAFLDRFYFSIEGSLLFNRSDTNLTFGPGELAQMPPSGPGKGGASFGVAIGGAIDPIWDWRLGWQGTWFQTQRNTIETFDPAFPGVFPYTTTSSNGILLQTFDAELGYKVPTPMGALRLFVGPRVLNARNHIDYGYDSIGDDKLGTFDHDVSLWGIGPRGGFEATLPLAASPAFVTITGSASAIFAQVNHHYRFDADPNPGNPTAGAASFDGNRTIYNLEASAALGYRFTSMATFQLGYRVQHWSNLATRVHAVNDIGGVAVGTSDVLAHGPFARFTVSLP